MSWSPPRRPATRPRNTIWACSTITARASCATTARRPAGTESGGQGKLTDAQFNLGMIYYIRHQRARRRGSGSGRRGALARAGGRGGSPDGETTSMCQLVDEGKVVERDLSRALAFCREAADSGIAGAQFTTGLLLAERSNESRHLARGLHLVPAGQAGQLSRRPAEPGVRGPVSRRCRHQPGRGGGRRLDAGRVGELSRLFPIPRQHRRAFGWPATVGA